MTRQQVEQVIRERLEQRRKKVLNRNAFQALFGTFADPVGSLGKVFLGRHDAMEAEQGRIAQDVILDLLCRLDEALTRAREDARDRGVEWTVIAGSIEAHGQDTEEVIGVHVEQGAGAVELQRGTRIRATASRTRKVTGVRVGGTGKKEDET